MKKLTRSFAALALGLAGTAPALEIDPLVPPEINLGGRALGTVNLTRGDEVGGGDTSESELDISDSTLLFGFSKYLFTTGLDRPPGYGFGVIGIMRPDHTTDLKDEIYFHELHAGIGGASYEVKLGRSRMPNSLVRFPTIRDDDLLDFTHVGNASSHNAADVYQVFGTMVEAQWWPSASVRTHAGVVARVETDALGSETSNSDFNSANIGIAYTLPEAIKFDRGVRFAGIALDSQKIDELDDEKMHALVAGLIYNLNDNPEADWVWETQAIVNDGVDGITALASPAQRARAKSTSLVTALRFNKRPYLQTRWQAGLTLAFKDYRDVDDASSFAVAPSFLYRLGSGIDWVTQYIYTQYDDGLASAVGVNDEHRIYTGLSFAFDHTFNESVAERGNILQIEHDMGVSGPSIGGH